ncbi:hypothetical protein [Comamonas jiangduensis]|uniref:hypothetical protein n=1 Tax=Comamonas jiangduensis TaxID=1194168 RepID=UPI0028A63D4C|nr:hypothetical protein [Comamonas jiangduensis]
MTSIASGSRSSQYTGMVRVLRLKTVPALLGSKEQALQATAHRAIRLRRVSVVMLPGKNDGYGQVSSNSSPAWAWALVLYPVFFPLLPTLTTDVEPQRKKPADFFRKSAEILITAVTAKD